MTGTVQTETPRLRVATVVGTRPEIIRLSRVLPKLDHYTDHTLIHTGQNYDYELNEIFFEDLGLRRPDHFLSAAGANAAETIGNTISRVDPILAQLRPQALLILGDTNSCLSALAAKRRHIPIFHMEAGNRCFDQRVPEEVNRVVVDHVADINLTYSDIAREYLLREGLPADRVIKTGSPMFEVISHYREKIDRSGVLARLALTELGYFLVSAHREENVEPPESFERLVKVLNSLASTYNLPVIVSTHPRTRARIDGANVKFDPRIRFLKPLAFTDYVRLELSATAVLSDSGTITEESSILNFPALNIREAHERLEGMEEGAVMLVGLNVERIHQGLAVLADQPRESRLLRQVHDYSHPNVSDKVLRLIMSYTDVVQRIVWRKSG
jgi:UDP-N-acetylglucosamine 2-epimerase (non-hydrolysing)